MGFKIGGLNTINHSTIYGRLQRFVTGIKATHAFCVLQNYYGESIELDAELSITLALLDKDVINNPDVDYWIFDIPLTDEQSYEVEKKLFKEFIGQTYGFGQLFYFVLRRIDELFGRDIRLYKNWIPYGTVCSEINWWALKYCSEYIPKIWDYIKDWLPDNFSAGDSKKTLYKLYNDGIIKLDKEKMSEKSIDK